MAISLKLVIVVKHADVSLPTQYATIIFMPAPSQISVEDACCPKKIDLYGNSQ